MNPAELRAAAAERLRPAAAALADAERAKARLGLALSRAWDALDVLPLERRQASPEARQAEKAEEAVRQAGLAVKAAQLAWEARVHAEGMRGASLPHEVLAEEMERAHAAR